LVFHHLATSISPKRATTRRSLRSRSRSTFPSPLDHRVTANRRRPHGFRRHTCGHQVESVYHQGRISLRRDVAFIARTEALFGFFVRIEPPRHEHGRAYVRVSAGTIESELMARIVMSAANRRPAGPTLAHGARALAPMHISIRVPWHDSGWDGTVCRHPETNLACLVLPRVAEDKDEAHEVSLRSPLE
jgi:hypothetical protein